MAIQPIDTNPEAEKFLISLLRKASLSKKINSVESFSASIIKLSRRAISRANPDLSEQEKNILFVKYHYGKALADKLEKYLNQLKNEKK